MVKEARQLVLEPQKTLVVQRDVNVCQPAAMLCTNKCEQLACRPGSWSTALRETALSTGHQYEASSQADARIGGQASGSAM